VTLERFVFQQEQTRLALAELPGLILNVGCNEDAGDLKGIDPDRVVNCDLFAHDSVMDRPNRVDVLFDCAQDTWPFDDDTAALVVIGDTLEHLTAEEQVHALSEARRVAKRLAITVPEDHRDTNNDETADQYPKGAVHRSVVTRESLRQVLTRSGWEVKAWRNVWYEFVPLGFFVVAE
jgi:hypothetical protein